MGPWSRVLRKLFYRKRPRRRRQLFPSDCTDVKPIQGGSGAPRGCAIMARSHNVIRKDVRPLIANFRLYLVRFMRLLVLFLCACLLAIAEHTFSSETTSPSQASGDEQTLWNLERAYWRYVEHNDLAAYSDLWHKDFLGWPSVSSAPVRKDHITDWITFRWVDKDGTGASHTLRITHAWVRSGQDWQIIGGMSMPEPENPAK